MGYNRNKFSNFKGHGRGGKSFRKFDLGPPEHVIKFGYYTHQCEEQLVCKSELEDVPYFNAPVYLENKQQIGKIDEIVGSPKDYYVSVILAENIKASSFRINDKIYIDPRKLLPISRFLCPQKGPQGNRGKNSQRKGQDRRGGFKGPAGGFKNYNSKFNRDHKMFGREQKGYGANDRNFRSEPRNFRGHFGRFKGGRMHRGGFNKGY